MVTDGVVAEVTWGKQDAFGANEVMPTDFNPAPHHSQLPEARGRKKHAALQARSKERRHWMTSLRLL